MELRKWNYEKHEYEPYEIPDEWNCLLYSDDMEEVVNCPHCGKEIEYGETYTSLEFHNMFGLGFGVCEECYEKEWDRKRNNQQCNICKEWFEEDELIDTEGMVNGSVGHVCEQCLEDCDIGG